jgi:hypothetical protein
MRAVHNGQPSLLSGGFVFWVQDTGETKREGEEAQKRVRMESKRVIVKVWAEGGREEAQRNSEERDKRSNRGSWELRRTKLKFWEPNTFLPPLLSGGSVFCRIQVKRRGRERRHKR